MDDFKSGVQIQTFFFKKKHLCNTSRSSTIKSVLFDWDKTLCVHAGLDTSAKPSFRVSECYVGGKERMDAIRKFFRLAFWRRWSVRIMTSNPSAIKNKCYFRKLLSTICGGWIPIEYIQSSKTKHTASTDGIYGLQCKYNRQ